MKVLIVFLMVAVLAPGAMANEENAIAADAGFRLTYGSAGPASVDVATDGDATIKFMWLVGGLGTDAGDVLKAWPDANTSYDSAYALRSALPPRNFSEWGADGPDSCYVDLGAGTTEVIVTW